MNQEDMWWMIPISIVLYVFIYHYSRIAFSVAWENNFLERETNGRYNTELAIIWPFGWIFLLVYGVFSIIPILFDYVWKIFYPLLKKWKYTSSYYEEQGKKLRKRWNI